MGLLTSLARRSIEIPSQPITSKAVEELFDGPESTSGVRINADAALSHSAWWRGINLISGDVAKLPLYLYRRAGDGKERATEHPAYQLLRYKPCLELTAFVFRQTLQAHALLHGNGYAYIYRDALGKPYDVVPMCPESSTTFPVRENGMLMYVTHVDGTPRKLFAHNVLHIRGLGYDGLCGYSVLDMAKEELGLGLGQRKYSAIYFKNGARPAIVLQHPGKLSAPAQEALRNSWDKMHGGLDNAHRTAVLQEGMQANVISFNPEDSQLKDSRLFDLIEVANRLGLPVHKVGHPGRTAYNSLENENQSYLDESLDPWLVRWEEEARDKLLSEAEKAADSHSVEFNRKALVRADLAARTSAYKTAIETGWMNPDEVRGLENMNPIPEGKGQVYRIPEAKPPAPTAPPAIEQTPEPEPTPEPKQLPDAGRAVLQDALKRAAKRIGLHARKAARTPNKFMDWLDKVSEEHARSLEEILAPALTLAGRAETPTGILKQCHDELLELSGSATPAELFKVVNERCNQWELDLWGI